jgi:signal transduction histidine kinase
MKDSDLLERLIQHRTLGGAPREDLAWLTDHGVMRLFETGVVSTRRSQPEDWLYVVLSGHIAIHVDRGAGSRRVIEWRGGDVCGLMPYSRGGAPPGDTVVEEPTEALAIHRDQMPELIRECPGVTARLVHAMLDRARHFTSSDLHDEKLVSLGRLAAGLAHELNNPASAAERSAKQLASSLVEMEGAARAVATARLTDAQLAVLAGLWASYDSGAPPVARSPIERADREEAIGAWIESHGLDPGAAVPLAETEVTLEALDRLAGALPASALESAIRGMASGRLVRTLASEIGVATSRIHELVGAVKAFTYMDRLPAAEAIDLRQGIRDALTVLAGKARAKAVRVTLTFAPELPLVVASGAELNQVWANLIDNALDAVAGSGHVEVTTRSDRDRVIVSVVDDGPGIPPELRARVFEPFFTTKEVGQGMGLGLDIVRRLIQRQLGEIDLDSRPGRTEFRVSLPAQERSR